MLTFSFELPGLILAAILVSATPLQRSASRVWATVPPSFVVDFCALLLLGPHAMTAVAVAGAIMQALVDREPVHRIRRAAINIVTVAVAAQAGGWLYLALGGTPGTFAWPMVAGPIAAATAGYAIVKGLSAEIIVPLLLKRSIERAWPVRILSGVAAYVIGASVGAGCAVIVGEQAWDLAPVVIVPLFLIYRAYDSHLAGIEESRRRREVLESLDHGMAVIDTNGTITLWDEGLERILGCSSGHAVGRRLSAAIPAMAQTPLPQMIADVLSGEGAQLVSGLELILPARKRTVRVKVVPVAGGVTMLWSDDTGRLQEDTRLSERAAQLMLATEGAGDGLWEWNLQSQVFYCSSRWRELLGLDVTAQVTSVREWLNRIHADDRAEMKAALDQHLAGAVERLQHVHRVRHEDGTYRPLMLRSIAVRGADGRAVRIAGSLTDLTERAAAAATAQSNGSLDSLTGLGNRAVFVGLLERRLASAKLVRGSLFAALYLDLDRFKIVNDNLGHLVGDELLVGVARRLESCLRAGDTVARLGGDEFAILLNQVGAVNQANAIAFRILESFAAPFSIGGRDVFTSASIGIACGPAQYDNPEAMLRDADTAMYHAKSRGKARHEMFDADMHARELDRIGLETDLRHAMNTNGFELHYQPIVLLNSGMCVGFESLARWTRNGVAVSPAVFIPLAEELGIVEPLGNWALKEACTKFADWKKRYPAAGLEYVTVNVSSRQLMQDNFLRIVERVVEETGIARSDLRLEITETALMDNPDEAAKLLRALRDFGTKIYLDDFGCGYSSLSHLAKLPVDVLKIDRSFVRTLSLPDRPAIVESILALARTLHTGVVAEGIEQETQWRELERMGCTHAQGYLFSRPVTAQRAEEIIAAQLPLGPDRSTPTEPPADSGGALPRVQWPGELATQST